MKFFYHTLYGRLIGSLVILLLCLFIAASVMTQRKMNAQINTNYDIQLMADANVLWTLVHEELEENNGTLRDISLDPKAANLSSEQKDALYHYNNLRAFRVWSKGRLLVKSAGAAGQDLPPFLPGFSHVHVKQDDWRVYTLTYPDRDAHVEAWERLNNRKELQRDILLGQLEIAVWGLPLLISLLLLTVFVALSSLARITKMVRHRRADDLSALADPLDVPVEVRPLVQSLNDMMTRIRSAIEQERDFLDHVSHELRTPLTTIKILSQTIHQAPTEAERKEGLRAIEICVDNTTRIVNQLLLLSRIEQEQPVLIPICLSESAQDILKEFTLIAGQKRIDLRLETDAAEKAPRALGNPELVRVLIRVLLDNALKYTPANGVVTLRIQPTRLILDDSGPGIPVADRVKVMDRFYRADDTKLVAEGSGVGLAIAQKICKILNINMTLDDAAPPPGLQITLDFPATF